jgi:uncharacterized protein with PQ loop repeat
VFSVDVVTLLNLHCSPQVYKFSRLESMKSLSLSPVIWVLLERYLYSFSFLLEKKILAGLHHCMRQDE